jgi:AcrR family transcriptional regulator
MPKVSEEYLEARRQEILDAAITCFTRNGFHKTSMDDICREAEVSPGALYRYFTSKEEIIEAAARKGTELELTSWVEEEAARFDDFLELTELFTGFYFQVIEQRDEFQMVIKLRLRAWAEALQNPEVKEEVLDRWEQRIGLSEQMVRRAQELGQINPDLDPGAVARVMQAIDDGFTLFWTINPDFDIWKFREAQLALYGGTFWMGEKEESD